MSPRRFKRRTYIIVASGRSTLTFSAATSVSSAWTTIRSAFPFTLSPTVNCQDILEPSKVREGRSPHHSASQERGRAPGKLAPLLGCRPAPQVSRAHRCRKFRNSTGTCLSDPVGGPLETGIDGITGLQAQRAFSFTRFLYRGLLLPLVFLWLSAHVSSPEKEKLEKSPWLTDR